MAAPGASRPSGSTLNQFATDGSPVLDTRSDGAIRDASWSLTGKLMHSPGSGHNPGRRWELEGARRLETDATLINGQLQEGATGTDVTARNAAPRRSTCRTMGSVARLVGLRRAARRVTIRSRSDSGDTPVDNRSTVVSPLAHLVWRFDAPKRDQLRLSLTQSYPRRRCATWSHCRR